MRIKKHLKVLQNLIVKAKDEDRPIAIYLINEGFHPDFVYRIKSADTTADDIIETIEQGIENGFVTDMFYGGAFMGRGKNKHLQSKVIYESNLKHYLIQN